MAAAIRSGVSPCPCRPFLLFFTAAQGRQRIADKRCSGSSEHPIDWQISFFFLENKFIPEPQITVTFQTSCILRLCWSGTRNLVGARCQLTVSTDMYVCLYMYDCFSTWPWCFSHTNASSLPKRVDAHVCCSRVTTQHHDNVQAVWSSLSNCLWPRNWRCTLQAGGGPFTRQSLLVFSSVQLLNAPNRKEHSCVFLFVHQTACLGKILCISTQKLSWKLLKSSSNMSESGQMSKSSMFSIKKYYKASWHITKSQCTFFNTKCCKSFNIR